MGVRVSLFRGYSYGYESMLQNYDITTMRNISLSYWSLAMSTWTNINFNDKGTTTQEYKIVLRMPMLTLIHCLKERSPTPGLKLACEIYGFQGFYR